MTEIRVEENTRKRCRTTKRQQKRQLRQQKTVKGEKAQNETEQKHKKQTTILQYYSLTVFSSTDLRARGS